MNNTLLDNEYPPRLSFKNCIILGNFIIFSIAIIYGIYNITNLNEFDIQNDRDCIKEDKYDDYCSNKTESYLGKYHLGYKFNTDKIKFHDLYDILMFIPPLLTKSKYLTLVWAIFAVTVRNVFGKIGSGEKAAIWCFSSILMAIPVALFEEKILNMIN